jgi:orotidine-5'-phosphate decarboxylase
MPAEHFADRLFARADALSSQIIVGLDPRWDRLPEALRTAAIERHGVTAQAAADAFEAFNRSVIDAIADVAVAVKPQVAFYEQYGCAGMAAYSATIRYARERGLLVVADVKRNDIASTAAAYATAHLGGAPADVPASDDFVVDALTINSYLGSDGVAPFLDAGVPLGRGAFALVKTSNPSSGELQDVDSGGMSVYERMAMLVRRWGESCVGHSGYSALGAVVGATYPEELSRLRALMPQTPFLVPGYGAQGGGVADVIGGFDKDGCGALINASRSVIFAWKQSPWSEEFGEARWQESIAAAAESMRADIWDATHR